MHDTGSTHRSRRTKRANLAFGQLIVSSPTHLPRPPDLLWPSSFRARFLPRSRILSAPRSASSHLPRCLSLSSITCCLKSLCSSATIGQIHPKFRIPEEEIATSCAVRSESKKRQLRSNQTIGESGAVAPDVDADASGGAPDPLVQPVAQLSVFSRSRWSSSP